MKMQPKLILIVVISMIIPPLMLNLFNNILVDYIDKSYTSYDLEKISIDIMKKINGLKNYDEKKIKAILWKEKEYDDNLDFILIRESGRPFFATFEVKRGPRDFDEMIAEEERNIDKGAEKSIKFVKYFDQTDYLLVKPIIINNEPKGQFAVTVKKEFILPFYIGINKDKAMLFYLILFLLFLSTVVISFLLVFFLTIPMLKRMKKLYNRINGYEPDKPVVKFEDKVNDEIGVISGTFDMMVEKINAYYEEERRLYSERQELFRNVSHDFRTPLTSILGYATTLDERLYENDEEAHTYYRIIRKKAEYMSELFNEMMELYKLESDMIDLKKAPFNIAELVREIIIEYMPQFDKENFYYDNDIQDTVMINGDRERISRAVRNLIDNVLKHCSSGKYFYISLFEKDGYVEISIKDKGDGISRENLDRIFDRFYKSTKKGGMGLGLSIAKEIAVKHGGTLSVKSDLGSGSVFTISLPLSLEDKVGYIIK